MRYFECMDYVAEHISKGTLKSSHTRKELANMVRTLEPYLVNQSSRACYSMCKQRMCEHLEFSVKIHKPHREYLKKIEKQIKGEKQWIWKQKDLKTTK